MMAGTTAGLMDTLLGILRRAALIDESRPDRGYAAVDRTRAFGARVGRRVGGSRIYIEQCEREDVRTCFRGAKELRDTQGPVIVPV